MVLKEMFEVSAPGADGGEPMRHENRSTAAQDMRHLEERGITPVFRVILVPVNPPRTIWG